MQPFSIKFRLSLAFCLLLFLLLFLGVFSISCLHDFNEAAEQIRSRWLPDTRYLGDLNNYTSDFRAAEGSLLLAASKADIAASEREIEALDRTIAKAQRSYEALDHNDKEHELYRRFNHDWGAYRMEMEHVLDDMHASHKDDAVGLYKTTSQAAYDTASDRLGLLTDLTVAEDQEASDRAAEMYREVQFLTLATMVCAVLLVVAGVLYIRRAISGPMLHLAEQMHRLAGNDTDVAIQGTMRRDEIGEMARAVVVFRNNTIDLALSRQGLEQQASMLEEKLDHERKLMEAQRNFVSMASHEFRTPLTIIDGHAQRLAKIRDTQKTEDITQRADKIRHAVRQMTALIDNLINASRLFESTPELYFHPAPLDLAALLREVCEQHKEAAPGTSIAEVFDMREMRITGDTKLLQQMFGNLLSNAIKYSPAGAHIIVDAKHDHDHISVGVRDNGMGIPAKDMDALFTRYFRGSNVTAISGSGIGLYLARTIARLHGGDIAVHSVEGQGATFTVRLPVRA